MPGQEFRKQPWLVVAIASLWLGLLLGLATPANAVPAFAQQTGQPCAACHVGAFGPQLKPYGRDFKLFGYQSADGASKVPPIAATIQTSVTHTNSPQNPPPTDFGPNNNFAVDQISLYYAGKLPMGWGAFAQVTYDGVARGFNLDNFDVRRAKEFTVFGKDSVGAIDINNNPTVEDVWNSSPAWGFPYNGSELAPGSAAATVIDGGLGGQVIGAGAYVLVDDTYYADFTAYVPLERQFAGRLGEGENGGSDRYVGVIPYWRLAYLKDIGTSQTFEVGTYGLHAERYPAGVVQAGVDSFTDWAADTNYQYIGSSKHVISAHATYLHEDQDLGASSVLNGTRPRNTLTTARADLSYSFKDTWTPSLQVFNTTGTNDPAIYTTGPHTKGFVAELAYTPFGKPDSPLLWINARFALQYVAYTEFDSVRHGASDNNTLYLNMWLALAPLGALVHR